MKVRRLLLGVLTILFIGTLAGCSKENTQGASKLYLNRNKYVDIYDIVKEAFITERGYTDDLAKHMAKDVFDKINVYNVYIANDPSFNKPYKVEFTLKELRQREYKEKIIVDMSYTVKILDSDNKVLGGSWNVPISFTVEDRNGDWYIVDKEEEA